MTMTPTEERALALVNETAEPGYKHDDLNAVDELELRDALIHAAKQLEATEARHAAELREQAERFSEAVLRHCGGKPMGGPLAPFIIAKPDPLVEAWGDMLRDSKPGEDRLEVFRAAIEARGGKIVWGDTHD